MRVLFPFELFPTRLIKAIPQNSALRFSGKAGQFAVLAKDPPILANNNLQLIIFQI